MSNLDAKLRQEVRVEIRELQRKLGLTTVMVTHDQEEALTMADRLVVMSEGAVRQIGTQRDLYERPADRFVAGFVGRSNFIEGRIGGARRASWPPGGLVHRLRRAVAGKATLALRPERLAIDGAAQASRQRLFRCGSNTSPIWAQVRPACPPVAAGAHDRADAEPAGPAAAGGRRQVQVGWSDRQAGCFRRSIA